MHLPLSLAGLVAVMLTQVAASPLLSAAAARRQSAGCTVTIGACPNGSLIELELTECACACLANSCDELYPLVR
ncbi:unnamed protein product [Parascedosporium putredinis]|uniref:Uncharacterized protein n=1 Tax=Parascedosporium putredinis TaxID=1442378 RepID=A0A9P1H2Y4_9PEZI|nr:unnamed protein product [Parascedosporium putredinis]CAI7996417.1 unnamed protein product [Parascedosporium putredinis]